MRRGQRWQRLIVGRAAGAIRERVLRIGEPAEDALERRLRRAELLAEVTVRMKLRREREVGTLDRRLLGVARDPEQRVVIERGEASVEVEDPRADGFVDRCTRSPPASAASSEADAGLAFSWRDGERAGLARTDAGCAVAERAPLGRPPDR